MPTSPGPGGTFALGARWGLRKESRMMVPFPYAPVAQDTEMPEVQSGTRMKLLTFHPIFKRALWGGRRLELVLGKSLGPGDDFAESWEVADLPGDSSVFSRCNFTGRTLREAMATHSREMLGVHADRDRFPLLIKFLDAQRRLSVQVHPSKAMAATRPEVTTGKAELWIILQAEPGSRVYTGLKPGVDLETLRTAALGEGIEDCLHSYEVAPGDVILLLPGTVHALGEGVLLAEVQEPNNVTYRLSDWGRLDANGQPRELHLDLALEATNFDFGPVGKVTPQLLDSSGQHERLVQTPHFTVHRRSGEQTWTVDDDNRMHALVCLRGTADVRTTDDRCTIRAGNTLVVPAERQNAVVTLSADAVLIDSFLDDQ